MKQPLNDALVAQGLCQDKKQAVAFVLAGQVLVNGQPARPGMLLKPGDDLRLKEQQPYASRGGLKLAGALTCFKLSPQGMVCLDAGASTGGFTDCLLQHGASLVYAVDVGFGQLTGALRQDDRVVNLERTNLSDPRLLALSPRPSFATCDLSYLSLREAVPLYREILGRQGQLLALVKPLFEVDDMEARRTGQIVPAAYAPMLADLSGCLNSQQDTAVAGVCASPVTGNTGTHEFFFHVRFGQDVQPADLTADIVSSVQQVLLAK